MPAGATSEMLAGEEMMMQYSDDYLAERTPNAYYYVEGGEVGPDVPADFDLSDYRLVSALLAGEQQIRPVEMLRRAKADLNAWIGRKYMWHLLNNQGLIPESWKEEEWIFFVGDTDLGYSVLAGICTEQIVMGMYWDKARKVWDTCFEWIDDTRHNCPWLPGMKLLAHC